MACAYRAVLDIYRQLSAKMLRKSSFVGQDTPESVTMKTKHKNNILSQLNMNNTVTYYTARSDN